MVRDHVNLEGTNDLTDDGLSARQATGNEVKAVPRTASTLDTFDVNCQDSHGYTPLLVSARRGHDEVVTQMLRQVSMSVNLINEKGGSPLLNAVCEGHEAVVKLLIAHTGVDINLAPPHTEAWRILSIEDEDGKVFLAGADTAVDTGSDKCWTPLIAAAFFEHERILKLLLAHHAVDVNCKDIDGRMALGIAAKRGNDVMVKSLLEVPRVDLNSRDDSGHTALSRALYGWLDDWWAKRQWSYEDMDFTKHEAVAELLLTRTDIDIDSIDNEGNNLLSRVTKYARETPEPRLEGTIALLRTAMDNRSRAVY